MSDIKSLWVKKKAEIKFPITLAFTSSSLAFTQKFKTISLYVYGWRDGSKISFGILRRAGGRGFEIQGDSPHKNE